ASLRRRFFSGCGGFYRRGRLEAGADQRKSGARQRIRQNAGAENLFAPPWAPLQRLIGAGF
ncbi:MAG: hypothetical protein KAH44_06660, partial [Oricola sp.]|nr:hypothetical protein [Oricola sp.]